MDFHLELVLAVVLYTECFSGIMVNMMILAAVLQKWKSLKSLNTYHKILGCLSVSRSSCLLCVIFVHTFFEWYPRFLLYLIPVISLRLTMMFFSFTNLWFTTILCVFYCLKITSYNWKFLTFLKTKLSVGVPLFLLVSLIVSGSCMIPFGFQIYDLDPKNLTNAVMENASIYNNVLYVTLQKQSQLFLLGSCPPFLIFCITICLLLYSLWMHTRRMTSSGSSFQSPNLKPHFSAVKSMSLFFVLHITHFILINVNFSGKLNSSKVWRMISTILTCSPSLLHSLYIILSNSDLKKTCISMVHAFTKGAHW
ncbi:taste receptor type 2 member 2-like [Anomaloglossus baeobatrachus]|uniref:taste receptor type 2 member 2-like n=1 Tax=Anomaloglossus baeobatrachus TaxID=238106 RepID=UPI003F4F9154